MAKKEPKCECKFVAHGEPMKMNGCPVHTQAKYQCDECGCDNYRPMGPPTPYKTGWVWKNCVCGHPAQEHN